MADEKVMDTVEAPVYDDEALAAKLAPAEEKEVEN